MSIQVWSDALTAALVFAADPPGTGVLLRARSGPVRERWLDFLRAILPPDACVKTLPAHIADGRLLGGLDLDATLRSGKPVAERGLLAEADGGVIVVAMAERLPSSTTAYLAAAMDRGETRVERDGVSIVSPARFGVVALDEGLEDEAAPEALRDRLALHLDLDSTAWRETDEPFFEQTVLADAHARLASVALAEGQIEALCNVGAALGVASLRAPLQALRVARAAAALAGRDTVEPDDIGVAARLVFAPRATIAPPSPTDGQTEQQPPLEDVGDSNMEESEQQPDIDRVLDEVILAAARAAIPADVLALLRAGHMRGVGRGAGKSGEMQKSKTRGRPTGTVRGDLRSGGKLNLIETLRAAAPWQKLRHRATRHDEAARVIVRPDDVRITRFRQRSESATIFVVDASGSAALHRLAEAKGAVELLLADCYVRRDQVALIAFRGTVAEIILPPTRSLARAKRSLAGLPGGGGTPLAQGLDAAFVLAESLRRKRQTPNVVVLTDGRANIARDGSPGRLRAEQDAAQAARSLRAAGIAAVLVDTSARPGPSGAQLAKDMNARYLPLPYADAATLSQAVKAAAGQAL